MREPWTRRQVVVVATCAVLGLGAAYLAFWFAAFLLPAEGLFSEPNDVGDRLVGAFAALVAALGAPAGLWAVARQRRSRLAAIIAAVIGAAIVAIAVGWALQIG